ncbi:hypothetical protein HMN09_00850000 [Mycena chlorophos]|uniref:Uncharacterized protein n=1 Tax=Mycena chlorophos TaxID=658473 RepID=A0A8H6ST94_MYCCL|nr:hypothetical protein HMN09_00850000 [Mycena chlorophos]
MPAPPADSPLATFYVGGKETKPFISVDQLKDHLALLHAFAELRARVQNTSAKDLGIDYFPPETEKERRWSVFVGFAVERFERWCLALTAKDAESGIASILPPLDVLMVWHTYLLNPGWYAEDCLRIKALQGLWQAGKALSTSLGNGLASLVRANATGAALQDNVLSWVRLTDTPFDPFEAIESMSAAGKVVECIKCGTPNTTRYLTADGTGYLQLRFDRICTKPTNDCFHHITHADLAMAKLAKDLALPNTSQPDSVLAGTLYTPGNTRNLAHAIAVKDRLVLFKNPKPEKPVTARAFMHHAQWQFPQLKSKMFSLLKEEQRVAERISNAYTDGRIFSVELVSAVLRQGSFVSKMHQLGWTKPGAFDSHEDQLALLHVVARYHAFLDLMAASPGEFLVPTLDIDLGWHTHQLRSHEYGPDTMKYVDVFVDHEDKVEETCLTNSFDGTGSAWRKRFGQPYSYCGCPLPGNSVGQRLSRLMSGVGFAHGHGGGTHPQYLQPPKSWSGKTASGTHPSAHNLMFPGRATATASSEQNKLKAAKKAEKERAKAKARGKCVLDPAFLVPVPLFVHNGPGAGKCAAVSGNLMNGERGGCTASAPACRSNYTDTLPRLGVLPSTKLVGSQPEPAAAAAAAPQPVVSKSPPPVHVQPKPAPRVQVKPTRTAQPARRAAGGGGGGGYRSTALRSTIPASGYGYNDDSTYLSLAAIAIASSSCGSNPTCGGGGEDVFLWFLGEMRMTPLHVQPRKSFLAPTNHHPKSAPMPTSTSDNLDAEPDAPYFGEYPARRPPQNALSPGDATSALRLRVLGVLSFLAKRVIDEYGRCCPPAAAAATAWNRVVLSVAQKSLLSRRARLPGHADY